MPKKIIIILPLIFVIFILLYYWHGLNTPFVASGESKNFIINKGEGVKLIAKNLREADLIKSNLIFELYVWLNNKQAEFKAGEYILSTSLNIKEIAEILTRGFAVNKDIRLNMPEGLTITEINERIKKSGFKFGDDFINLADKSIGNWKLSATKPDFLNDAPDNADLEGFLFPDTYLFFNDATADDVIDKMLHNFELKVTKDMRSDIKTQGKSIYEIIIMASIIQKEANIDETGKGGNEEAGIISGIFWDRLKFGQALQSDATLSYIFTDKNPQHTLEETQIDSPYNTYKYKGLPLGPIGNPGLEAIKAAIYPVKTEYNYFLNKLDSGAAVFSQTYEEHLRNKAKYLK